MKAGMSGLLLTAGMLLELPGIPRIVDVQFFLYIFKREVTWFVLADFLILDLRGGSSYEQALKDVAKDAR